MSWQLARMLLRALPAQAVSTDKDQKLDVDCTMTAHMAQSYQSVGKDSVLGKMYAILNAVVECIVMNPRIQCGGLQAGRMPAGKPWT